MKGLAPVALVLALSAAACDTNTSSPSTTTPSVTIIAEMFTGTVDAGGSAFHEFTVSQPGQVSTMLTAAGPPSTITMGLGIGVPSGSTCAVLPGASKNTPAGPIAQLSGTVSAGTLCVQVYDVGNQTNPITYSVTVIHP
jgi:hypothetical protein